MRIFLVVLMFLLTHAGISFAQGSDGEIPRQIFTTVEQMPVFPGNIPALRSFLSKHLRYPEIAYKNNTEGTVQVRFVVEVDGSVSNAEITQKLSPECDEEALRVIRKMPRWNPGMHDGRAVAVYYTIPVSFRLH